MYLFISDNSSRFEKNDAVPLQQADTKQDLPSCRRICSLQESSPMFSPSVVNGGCLVLENPCNDCGPVGPRLNPPSNNLLKSASPPPSTICKGLSARMCVCICAYLYTQPQSRAPSRACVRALVYACLPLHWFGFCVCVCKISSRASGEWPWWGLVVRTTLPD